MKKNKPFFERWWVGLALLALLPFFWWFAHFLATFIEIPDSNFFKIWLAGNLTGRGIDPYSPAAWLAGHQHAGSTWIPEKASLYPLPLAVLLIPLGAVSLNKAYVIWAFLTLLACLATLFLLINKWDESKYKLFAFPMSVAIFLFAPTLETAGKGSIGGLLLLGMVIGILLLDSKKSVAGGAFLTILLLKPQLGIPILAVMAVWMLFDINWHGIGGLAAGSLLLFFIGFASDPHWISKFIQSSQHKLGLTFGTQPTIFSITYLACSGKNVCTLGLGGLLTIGLLGFTVYFLFRKSKQLSALQAASIVIPVGILVTPYLWSYDHVLLIIPFTWIVAQLIQHTKTYVWPMVFLILMDVSAAIGLYLQAIRPEKDFWSITVPVFTLIVVVAFSLKHSSEPAINKVSSQ